MNNLKLMKTENFENEISCDFWVDINGEYFITREQIGTALGYSKPEIAISKIHNRHKNRLDKYSTLTNLGRVEGGRYVERERVLYSRKGIMEICRWSDKPLADKFMDWCWEVIDNLISNQDSIDHMINMLEMICKDSFHFISLYIFDANWGNETCYFKDEFGEKLPFKTIDDLYNLLDNLRPWELKFCCGDTQEQI